MITGKIKKFIEETPVAFVASTDQAGHPHLAAATGLKVESDILLSFENWFCTTTINNVAHNPAVAIAVTTADAQTGYQFIGTVRRSTEEAILNGYSPEVEKPGTPQTLVQLTVQVEKVMGFSARTHSDLPVEDR